MPGLAQLGPRQEAGDAAADDDDVDLVGTGSRSVNGVNGSSR